MSDIDKNSILSLLDDAKPIIDKIQKEEYAKKVLGENFNLFSVFGIERREIYVCKMIGDLLSPQGRHGLGSVFIKKFFEQEKFAAFNITDSELETATVVCEKSTSEGRRIDFVIQTASWIIPIEAKIDAEDQPNQCADYFFEIEDRAKIYGIKSSKIYYLTLDGRRPSPNSMGKLTDSQVDTLTWKENILAWLEDCCNLAEVQRRNIVFTNIRQLVETIKGWYKSMDNELLTYIESNPERLNSAIQIWHNMELKKDSIRENFNEHFIQYARSKGIEPIDNSKDGFEILFLKNKNIGDKQLDISLFFGRNGIGFRIYHEGNLRKFSDSEIRLTLDDFKKSNVFRSGVNLTPSKDESCIHEIPYPPLNESEPINVFDISNCPSTMKLLSENNMKDYLNLRIIPLIRDTLTDRIFKEIISCDKETPVA